eukprot:4775129-Prymnesium_polylepis.1
MFRGPGGTGHTSWLSHVSRPTLGTCSSWTAYYVTGVTSSTTTPRHGVVAQKGNFTTVAIFEAGTGGSAQTGNTEQ